MNDTSDFELDSIKQLIKGKTDSQLLYALVAALTERNYEQLTLLLQHASTDRTKANIQIAAAICAEIVIRKENHV